MSLLALVLAVEELGEGTLLDGVETSDVGQGHAVPRVEPQHAAEAGAEIDRLSSAIEQLLERMEHKRPR